VAKICELLIGRFKERPSVALRSLITSRFTFSDIRSGLSFRAHVQTMLYHARSAEFDKEYNILLLIWNSLDLSLRQQVDEPERHTTMAQFLAKVDAKWPIWQDIAHRPAAPFIPRQGQAQAPSRTPYQLPSTATSKEPVRQAPIYAIDTEEKGVSIWDDNIEGFVAEYNATNIAGN
jgi:hypothetical protein